MSDAHIAMDNTFLAPDPASFGAYKMLEEIYPAFAKKIFQNNPFMQKIVMSSYNAMPILDYPICGKCETLAAWSMPVIRNGKKIRTCHCFANGCGHDTVNPVIFRTWLTDELRRKAPPNIAEIADLAVDMVAESMKRVALANLMKAIEEQNKINEGENK